MDLSVAPPGEHGVSRTVTCRFRFGGVPASTFLAAADQRAKALTLRAALGLPDGVQRALAGRRVTIDGQTLAVDTQLMLRLEKVVREPSTEDLPLAGRTPAAAASTPRSPGATSRSARSATCPSATGRVACTYRPTR